MNANRFTEKLQEALGRAQNAALTAHNQAVDVEHLLAALLEDDDGLASSIIALSGVDRSAHMLGMRHEYFSERALSSGINHVSQSSGRRADRGAIDVWSREHPSLPVSQR